MYATVAATESAKVFMTGRSQAVRLPKSCRFDVREVSVQRVGQSVVLTPKNADWGTTLREVLNAFAEEAPFERAADWPQAPREALLP